MSAEKQSAVEQAETMDLQTALVQMDVMPGNPDVNVAKMIQEIEAAQERGDDVLVFPEMCVPGYLIGDDWLDDTLVKDFESYNEKILEATRNFEGLVLWGNVKTDEAKTNEDGSLRKYNAVYFAQKGEMLGERYKTALPNYGEFDDKRYFTSTAQLAEEEGRSLESYLTPVQALIRQTKIAVGGAVCEDGWGSGEANDYSFDVMKMLADSGADFLANLSCSPTKNGKNFRRNQVFGGIAAATGLPLVYGNNVGTQNNGKNIIPFDGGSTIYNPDGTIQEMKDDFKEGVVQGSMRVTLKNEDQQAAMEARLALLEEENVQISALRKDYAERAALLAGNAKVTPFPAEKIKHFEPVKETKEAAMENTYKMLLTGVKDFFRNAGKSKATIALSGGADSALVTKLMVDALGAENVYAVNMPSKYNSDTTKDKAAGLAAQLGIHYAVAPIQDSVELTEGEINQLVFTNGEGAESTFELSDFNMENVQARDRGARLLLGINSVIGGLATNNGNKSEVLVGYSTIDGDGVGDLAPIADLYKSEVWDLMHHLAAKDSVPALQEIANLIPSAELSEDQSIDEDNGDPFDYYYHDKLMFQLLEMRANPADILTWYQDGVLEEKLGVSLSTKYCGTTEAFITDLERIYRLFKLNVFKRVQGCPIIRVSRKGFGFDLRESMLQGPLYYTQGYENLKSELLAA